MTYSSSPPIKLCLLKFTDTDTLYNNQWRMDHLLLDTVPVFKDLIMGSHLSAATLPPVFCLMVSSLHSLDVLDSIVILEFYLKLIATQTFSTASYTEKCALKDSRNPLRGKHGK